jgi:hypothetical protein
MALEVGEFLAKVWPGTEGAIKGREGFVDTLHSLDMLFRMG